MDALKPESSAKPAQSAHFTSAQALCLLATMAELFVLMDEKLRVCQANPAFCTSCGYPADALPNLCLADLFEPETASQIQHAFAKNENLQQEALLQASDGQRIPVRLRASTLIEETGKNLCLLVCTDLSERQELLEQMREDRRQLRRSFRLASLGEMVAGIGHELTQPLNAILLFARNCLKILDHTPPNEAMLRENLEIIVDRVNRASSTIQIMRGFARLEEEGGRRPVEINALLRKILRFLDSQLRLNEVELKLDLSEQPCVVNALEVSLEQVFLNIIQNAIQAMGRVDAPSLHISTSLIERLDVKSMEKESHVSVRIADNGEGMAEEVRKKIFDPFFTTRETGIGTGLGLSIVDRLVRGFSGSIEVESAAGKGSAFTVSIPGFRPEEEHILP